MKKLSLVFMLFAIAFISNCYAQLPNNPANPHGTILNDAHAHAEWEKVGDSLYVSITITTPCTYVPYYSDGFSQNFVQFYANHYTSTDFYEGSINILFDAATFPYGTHTYNSIINIAGWDPDWIDVQADYGYITGSTENPQWVYGGNLIDSTAWDPWP